LAQPSPWAIYNMRLLAKEVAGLTARGRQSK
jgi:hypothetical protein